MAVKQVHIRVKGRVQGVFFRAHTHEVAERFGIRGWVWNTPDGAVEIVAEGDEVSLKSLIEWCHHGPPSAGVTEVKTNYSEPTGEFDSFKIKYF